MKKGMQAVWVMVTALALVAGFSGSAWAEDPIKVASMEPLSGTFKDIGERYASGVEYAVKVLNEDGGLLGRKIEFMAIDSELKPAVAMRKATKALQKDGVKFFFGGTGSSVGAAMSAFAERNNAITVSHGMAAASLTGEKCSPNFFRVALNTDQQSFALATWVAESGYKTVATIAQDYSFGHEATSAFIKKLNALNPSIKVVEKIFHKVGEKDFAPYISQIISSKAELVFTSNWGNDLSLLIKQAKPLGLKSKFVCYYLNDAYVIKSVASDDAVLGSVTGESYMLTIPSKKNKEFVKGFYKDKGYYPSWLPGKGYTAAMFWAEAVKKAGTTDVDAIIKAWNGLSFDSIAGTYYMRPCDHQAQMPVWIAKIVKKNPFFDHAFVGTPKKVPAKDVEVPCEETGCKMK